MTDWIEWNGGGCPVAEDVLVDYLMPGESDSCERAEQAGSLRWIWQFGGIDGGDIVAYRLAEPSKLPEGNPDAPSALTHQPSGTHYSDATIQPVQFIEANKLGFLEGSICKRITRHNHPTGKGAEDIRKIIHEAQLLLQLRYGEVA